MTNKLKANYFDSSKSAPSVTTYSIPLILLSSIFTLILTFTSVFYLIVVKYTEALDVGEILQLTFYSLMHLLGFFQDELNWLDWFYLLDNDKQREFIIATSIVSFLSLLASFIAGKWAYKKSYQSSERKISGASRYESKEAINKLSKALKEDYKFAGSGLPIHPQLNLSKNRESQNILVLGQIGAGKTQIIAPIVKDIIDRKAKSVVFDYKGDFTEWFASYEQVMIIAPWLKSSIVWSIGKDIKDKHSALLFATSVIPKNQKDPMWSNAGQIILTGCCLFLIKKHGENWGWKKLSVLLNSPTDILKAKLQQVLPEAANLVDPNSKTSQSILLTMYSYVRPIHDLALAWGDAKGGISLKSWVKDKGNKTTLIINQNQQYEQLSKSLAELVLNLISHELLSLSDSNKREFYFCLDETAHLNFDIAKTVSVARSKGARFIVGIQDLGLLSKQYTQEEINAFSSMIGTLIVLRVGAVGDSITKLSKALGEQQFERLNPSFDKEGKSTFSWQRLSLPVVAETELLNLPQANKKNGVTGFISIAGTNIVGKLTWPLTILPKVKFDNQPAKWVISGSTDPKAEKASLSKSNKARNKKVNLSELDDAFADDKQGGDTND
ncbi:hypothetical protein CWC14_11350 [Pseudoalteromonas sp. S3260]|uniref:type IV secretion system DNA-binding domain-containing protein n=1 Tax=Pseudoalteromonas sp. S3260 TaxID=579534 RepID=UPI00110B5677|nr:type IV secretion system DNA-binding domain-containing protein [Pseudoalteromonas sp. S3260]TMO96009.1 hypothetical protein CWC14_11350 [Pseudoalteromonas sp. S3260]